VGTNRTGSPSAIRTARSVTFIGHSRTFVTLSRTDLTFLSRAQTPSVRIRTTETSVASLGSSSAPTSSVPSTWAAVASAKASPSVGLSRCSTLDAARYVSGVSTGRTPLASSTSTIVSARRSVAIARTTERRVASRSRSSSPTLRPVDCGPFHPRNHHAWTLARSLWPPSQGYFCPCGAVSRLTIRQYNRLHPKRTRFLLSLLTRVARSLSKGPPRYLLGDSTLKRIVPNYRSKQRVTDRRGRLNISLLVTV
jgi:hypothetical protein